MLIRLLIVLIVVGPPGPQVCTCAAAKAAPAPIPAPIEVPVKKSCRCGHHSAQPSHTHSDSAYRAVPDCDHAAPANHEPTCPAANPRPAPPALAVVPVPADLASDAVVGVSFECATAPHSPLFELRSGAHAPHVPLFISFCALRN